MKLTQATVDAIKADGKERLLMDDTLSGFGIRVSKVGTKTFIAQARLHGRATRIPLGRSDVLSVAEARKAARSALGELANNKDPRRHDKQVREAGVTFKEFTERWLKEHIKPKRKEQTAKDYEGTFARHIYPAIGTVPLSDIAFSDLQKLHYKLSDRPRTANLVIGLIRNVIGYAEKLGLRKQGTNPGFKFEMLEENSRERFLSDDELANVADAIDALDGDGLTPWTAAAIRLLMLTGARSSEIRAIEWTQIDRDRGLAILPTSKNKRIRTIYLSPAAMQIIDSLPRRGKYVIAGNSINVICGPLTKQWEKIRKRADVLDVRLHDLRHTYASAALSDGLPLAVVGRLLGHVSHQATARYAHLASDPIAQAAQEIGSKIDRTMRKKAKATGEVTRLKRSTK